MKKFQSLMRFIAIANFVIWIALGVFSLYCAPSSVNELGYYNDDCDVPTVEDLKSIALEALKPVVVIYKPLVWLTSAQTDEQSLLFARTAFLYGFF